MSQTIGIMGLNLESAKNEDFDAVSVLVDQFGQYQDRWGKRDKCRF